MDWRKASVGAVGVSSASFKQDERTLLRMKLVGNDKNEGRVREILDTNFAIDVVDDPHGFYHEAVPYKHIIVGGPSELAESLKLTLPRYFGPLLFRKFKFEIYHMRATEDGFILFGDSLEADLGQKVGVITIEKGDVLHMPSAGGSGSIIPYRLAIGQGRSVIAIGETINSEGLPHIPCADISTQVAVSVSPGRVGPNIELRNVLEQSAAGKVLPVLGDISETAIVKHNKDFEIYDAYFPKSELSVGIVPENSFSRVVSSRRVGHDCLEITGVIVPTPIITKNVQAIALRFDHNGAPLKNGFIEEDSRFVMIGQREAYLLSASGSNTKIRRPKSSIMRFGLTLEPASSKDSTIQRSMALVHSDGKQSLGWIPLRIAEDFGPGSGWVNASEVRYNRSKWVTPQDTDAAGAAIYLDWLNHAVELVVDDHESGSSKIGLASWCSMYKDLFSCTLSMGVSNIVMKGPHGKEVQLRDGTEFQLGLLWVRFHSANSHSNDKETEV